MSRNYILVSIDPGPVSMGVWRVRIEPTIYVTERLEIFTQGSDDVNLTNYLKQLFANADFVVVEQQVSMATGNIRLEQHIVAMCLMLNLPYTKMSPNTRKAWSELDKTLGFKDACVKKGQECLDDYGLECLARTRFINDKKIRDKQISDMCDAVVQGIIYMEGGARLLMTAMNMKNSV